MRQAVERKLELRAYLNLDQLRIGPSLMPNSPPCILIVEDEPLICLIVADYLRDHGFLVIEAMDVAEAMTLLEARDVVVDLVFSDVHMPGELDGFDLARWVCATFPGLPVILASGAARTSDLAGELCAFAPIEAKPYCMGSVARRMDVMLAA